MSQDDLPRLIYLILLGCVVGSYFFASGRKNLSKTAQQALIWGIIFVGVIAGYGLWNDVQNDVLARQSVGAGGTIVIPRAPDGHYNLTVEINGTTVPFVVDTGASQIVLSQRDAQRVGLDPSALVYSGQAFTANGIVRTAPVTLDTLTLGPVRDRKIRAVVNEGVMDTSLLGMEYLNSMSRIEIIGGEMILTP